MDMKKIGGYPHNGYPTNIGTITGHIFIPRIGYERTTTRTLPVDIPNHMFIFSYTSHFS